MRNKKETRTCLGCRKKDNKQNLIRFKTSNENKMIIDLDKKAQGRGSYICKNEECLNKVLKNKALKLSIDEENLNKLRGVIFGGQ